jgi:hypothetical protein
MDETVGIETMATTATIATEPATIAIFTPISPFNDTYLFGEVLSYLMRKGNSLYGLRLIYTARFTLNIARSFMIEDRKSTDVHHLPPWIEIILQLHDINTELRSICSKETMNKLYRLLAKCLISHNPQFELQYYVRKYKMRGLLALAVQHNARASRLFYQGICSLKASPTPSAADKEGMASIGDQPPVDFLREVLANPRSTTDYKNWSSGHQSLPLLVHTIYPFFFSVNPKSIDLLKRLSKCGETEHELELDDRTYLSLLDLWIDNQERYGQMIDSLRIIKRLLHCRVSHITESGLFETALSRSLCPRDSCVWMRWSEKKEINRRKRLIGTISKLVGSDHFPISDWIMEPRTIRIGRKECNESDSTTYPAAYPIDRTMAVIEYLFGKTPYLDLCPYQRSCMHQLTYRALEDWHESLLTVLCRDYQSPLPSLKTIVNEITEWYAVADKTMKVVKTLLTINDTLDDLNRTIALQDELYALRDHDDSEDELCNDDSDDDDTLYTGVTTCLSPRNFIAFVRTIYLLDNHKSIPSLTEFIREIYVHERWI